VANCHNTTRTGYTTIYRHTAVVGITTFSNCYTTISSVTCCSTCLTISNTAVCCYTAVAAIATITSRLVAATSSSITSICRTPYCYASITTITVN